MKKPHEMQKTKYMVCFAILNHFTYYKLKTPVEVL